MENRKVSVVKAIKSEVELQIGQKNNIIYKQNSKRGTKLHESWGWKGPEEKEVGKDKAKKQKTLQRMISIPSNLLKQVEGISRQHCSANHSR